MALSWVPPCGSAIFFCWDFAYQCPALVIGVFTGYQCSALSIRVLRVYWHRSLCISIFVQWYCTLPIGRFVVLVVPHPHTATTSHAMHTTAMPAHHEHNEDDEQDPNAIGL